MLSARIFYGKRRKYFFPRKKADIHGFNFTEKKRHGKVEEFKKIENALSVPEHEKIRIIHRKKNFFDVLFFCSAWKLRFDIYLGRRHICHVVL